MGRGKKTQVRFLGGCAARSDLLGVLAFPVGFDGKDVEHTRFFMVNPKGWVHQPFDSDLVSAVFEDGADGKAWWLLGKRGDVHIIRPSGTRSESIPEAGTGPGRLGHLSTLYRTDGRLYACGYRHQIYVRDARGWTHVDSHILLGQDAVGRSLNDLTGNADGVLCAVGTEGEIAIGGAAGAFALYESPTNAHLHAVCVDDQGRFCAAGAAGTVVRGDAGGFEVLCTGSGFGDSLWDIEFHRGELVVSASAGLFIVRDGVLVPFDRPPPPAHTAYRLVTKQGMLWSIGTHRIFRLEDGHWSELVCPDNAP